MCTNEALFMRGSWSTWDTDLKGADGEEDAQGGVEVQEREGEVIYG